MIIKIVLTLILVCAIALIINSYEDKLKLNKRKISFKESMDLAELPVVTFYQGKKKFNFLLDTGSNFSHLSSTAAKAIKGEKCNKSDISVTGIGNDQVSDGLEAILEYKGVLYTIDFCVLDSLDSSFANIKAESGVTIHGILGNRFLQEYKYILDFDELTAYRK